MSEVIKFTCQGEDCGAEITAWDGAKGNCPYCWTPFIVLPESDDPEDGAVITWEERCEA